MAAFFSIVQGALMPAMSLFFEGLVNQFGPSMEGDALYNSVWDLSLKMIYTGFGVFGAAMLGTLIWSWIGSRHVKMLK